MARSRREVRSHDQFVAPVNAGLLPSGGDGRVRARCDLHRSIRPRTINADRLRRNVAIERKSVDQSLFRVGVEAGGILTVIPQPTAREMVFAVENDGTVDDRDSGFAHNGQSAREVRRILTLPYMVP